MTGRLNLVFSCLFFLTIISCIYCAKKDKSKTASSGDNDVATKARAKADVVATLAASMPLIPLSDKNFTKYITERPRLYHAAVVFTATNEKYQCEICMQQKQAYMDLAMTYKAEYDFNTTADANKLAFFILEVDYSRTTFAELNLETVPRFFLLPSMTLDDPKVIMSNFEKPNSVFLSGQQKILDEIEEVTKIKIHLTTNARPYLVLLCFISIVVAYVVSHAAQDISKALCWYQHKTLWIIASLLCFSVGVSGSIFCIIRSAPMYGYTRSGIMIFAGQGRDQYLIEGIIIALLTIGAAAAMSLAYFITKLPFPLVRHAGVLFFMSVFVLLSLQLFDHYVDKTRWYRVSDTIPPAIWSYFSSSVKKTSYLPKRMLRVSEIWLFEYKDWPTFQKKFKQLIIDYLIRVLGAEKYLGKTSD